MSRHHNFSLASTLYCLVLFLVQLGLNVLIWKRGATISSNRKSKDGIDKYLHASGEHLLPLYIFILRLLAVIYFLQLCGVFLVYNFSGSDYTLNKIESIVDLMQYLACCALGMESHTLSIPQVLSSYHVCRIL